MLSVYDHYKYFNSFSAGTIFIRQNLTFTDVRRIKTVPAQKGLNATIVVLSSVRVNPLTAKLFNLNFHSRVSRCRNPQLQVSDNYSDLTKWRSTVFKYC